MHAYLFAYLFFSSLRRAYLSMPESTYLRRVAKSLYRA